MLTLTIVIKNRGEIIDIMLRPEQRIQNVLTVLTENGKLCAQDRIFLRSWRLGTYLDVMLTFGQAGIQTGDMIYIEVEENESGGNENN